MSTKLGKQYDLPAYEQLSTSYDPESEAVWCSFRSAPRPCFTPTLLRELKHFQTFVRSQFDASRRNVGIPIRYFVASSAVPGVFNLGGDLALFQQLIAERDRSGLYHYARQCVDVLYANAVNLDRPVTTISLVQGSALGGGFEAAISSNVLIAERSAQMGLPEILFNLFPGMGAYSLLARRLDSRRAEELILSGTMYRAEQLYEMGLVDILAEDGEGEQAVADFIRRNSRMRNGFQAVMQARRRYHRLDYQELLDITDVWVEAALNLESKDLRMMDRLVRAQNRLGAAGRPSEAHQHVA